MGCHTWFARPVMNTEFEVFRNNAIADVYAQLCNGKIRKWKTKDAYASFRHEAEKMIRRAKESNCNKVNN